MRPGIIAGGIIVALIIIAAMQFWPQDQEAQGPAAPAAGESFSAEDVPQEPGAAAAEEAASSALPAPIDEGPGQLVTQPESVLPSLAASDDYVRAQTAQWDLPAALLQRSDLLSRLAVVLVNTADGSVPSREVAVLAPQQKFAATEQELGGEQVWLMDPGNYARFDRYLTMLEAIPPQSLADFLRRVEPLLLQALAQLGERRTPVQLLRTAADHLQQLPQLPAQVELIRPNVLYQYADPELERLPALDKQLLRFGPDNLVRLQRYLERFNQAYLPN